MSNERIAVIGGTGFAGRATVEALAAQGYQVRVIARSAAPHSPRVEPVRADATKVDELELALRDVRTAVVCSRPEYWQWPTELVPMFATIIEAARRTGTRLVLCDNLYAYGVPSGPMTESTPMRPHGPKGRARKEAAELFLRAHDLGAVSVSIGRAADFYGPGVEYPHLEMMFNAALAGRPVRLLGDGHAAHSMSYIADVGRGLATLATRDAAFGRVWHLPVAPAMSERAFVERLCAVAGKGSTVRTTPPWAVNLLFRVGGLFSPMLRELPEVQYQHEQPFVVDDSRFVRAFGVKATPLDEALRATLEFWQRRSAPSASVPRPA